MLINLQKSEILINPDYIVFLRWGVKKKSNEASESKTVIASIEELLMLEVSMLNGKSVEIEAVEDIWTLILHIEEIDWPGGDSFIIKEAKAEMKKANERFER